MNAKNKTLVPLNKDSITKKAEEIIENITVGDKKEVVSIVGLLLHNLASAVVPGYSVGAGTIKDYYDQKVNKKRQQEIDSFLSNLNDRLTSVEIKQEAIDYLENSIVFRLEEITHKLLTNPGRGFDEVISEFVANALQNMDLHPKTKDLILSTLLSLDSVDILVLKTMDKHFLSNLPKNGGGGAKGVTRDSICTLLKDRKMDEAIIDRSIQRLQSESLIQPMKVSASVIREVSTADQLYVGKRPDQYDTPGGFINTKFGRIFINFLKLNDTD